MTSLTERLGRCYTGAVHDVLRSHGHVVVCQPDNHEVATHAEEVAATETEKRHALVGGMDPVAAYDRYGKS